MHKVTVMIDGSEYVAVPKAEYLRLVDARAENEETVDALEYSLTSLGRSLRLAREQAGFTQAQLAKKLKKAQTTVSQAEGGKIRVSPAYVKKLLKVCGLPEDWKAP